MTSTYTPPGEPSWQANLLQQLAQQGLLSGVNPAVLGVMAQEESGYEQAGAGVNGSGYGGYFGLGANTTYDIGNGQTASIPYSTLNQNTPASFIQQSEVSAGKMSTLLSTYNGNLLQAETAYQNGSFQGQYSAGAQLMAQELPPSILGNAASGITQSPSGGSGAATANLTSATAPQAVTVALPSSAKSKASQSWYNGFGALLIKLDGWMNPSSDPVSSIMTLGLSNVAQSIQIVLFRGVFSVMFIGLGYIGFKTLTGQSAPDSEQILGYLKAQQSLSQRRSEEEGRNARLNITTESRNADIAQRGNEEAGRQARVAANDSAAKRAIAARNAAMAARAKAKQEADARAAKERRLKQAAHTRDANRRAKQQEADRKVAEARMREHQRQWEVQQSREKERTRQAQERIDLAKKRLDEKKVAKKGAKKVAKKVVEGLSVA